MQRPESWSKRNARGSRLLIYQVSSVDVESVVELHDAVGSASNDNACVEKAHHGPVALARRVAINVDFPPLHRDTVVKPEVIEIAGTGCAPEEQDVLTDRNTRMPLLGKNGGSGSFSKETWTGGLSEVCSRAFSVLCSRQLLV